jgi:hypothetical protein
LKFPAGGHLAESYLAVGDRDPVGVLRLAVDDDHGPVTTTRLRVVMQSAPTAGGVGAIQWIVPSIP